MKKFVIINDGNCFLVEAKDLTAAKAKTESPAIDHSKPVHLHEIKAMYGNVWRTAQKAIGSILSRLNKHNKETGWTVGIELNMIDEMNDLTRALSGLNDILGDNGK